MTTLEGELILAYIDDNRPELHSLLGTLPVRGPSPVMTTNQFASACLKGEAPDEEHGGWDFTPCVFLQDGCCSIYQARPFMCRSFGSRVRCSESGAAEVAPVFLTLTTIIMQCIEHLDQGRPWGNMNTILHSFAMTLQDNSGKDHDQAVLCSVPIPGFLIPPEEMEQLTTQLQTLLGIIRNT